MSQTYIGLDTLKIRSEEGFSPPLRVSDEAIRCSITNKDGETKTFETWNDRKDGGAYVRRNVDTGETMLEFSAKVLHDRYFHGLRNDTWQNVCEVLKDVSGVDGLDDPSRWNVSRADLTTNFFVDDAWRYIFAAKHGLDWERKKQDARFSDSAIFYNKQERLTFYDKTREDPETYSWSKSSVLRLEYQPKNLAKLAKFFPISANYFQHAENPVKDRKDLSLFLDHATQKEACLSIFLSMRRIKGDFYGTGVSDLMKFSGKRFSEIRKILGDLYLLEKFNGDRGLVRELMKTYFTKETVSRQYRAMEKSWQFEQKHADKIDKILNEIQTRLEDAA